MAEERPKEKIPDVLYHYTSAAGLHGIVDKRALRLSNIHYMNDQLEFRHFFDLFIEGAHQVAKERNEELAVKQATAEWIKYLEGKPMSPYYAFSMSKKMDSLSQWRGYAPEGGYAIGFKSAALNSENINLISCIYDDNTKKFLILKLVEELINGFSLLQKKTDEMVEFLKETALKFFILSPYFKHSSFQEEQEIRLVGLPGHSKLDLSSYVRNNLVIPCAFHKIDLKEAIVSVTIGPKLDKALAKFSVQHLFREINPDIEILESNSPLV